MVRSACHKTPFKNARSSRAKVWARRDRMSSSEAGAKRALQESQGEVVDDAADGAKKARVEDAPPKAPKVSMAAAKPFLKKVQAICGKCSDGGTRLSWDEYFGSMAMLASARSPCERLHVGCVIVRDRRVLSMGYNGFFQGAPHTSILAHGHEQATVHAEQNAISHAARTGISLDKATAYVTRGRPAPAALPRDFVPRGATATDPPQALPLRQLLQEPRLRGHQGRPLHRGLPQRPHQRPALRGLRRDHREALVIVGGPR